MANILRFLGRRESKLVRKNSKKFPKLFHYGFTEKNLKQKRPECPLKFSRVTLDPFYVPLFVFGGCDVIITGCMNHS